MFDIGWSELVVIAVVALIAIGPKELPGVLRMVGQWMGKARKMAAEFQGQFQEAMREAEMADLKKSFDEVREAATGLTSGGGLMTSLQKDVTDALRIDDIDKPAETPATPAIEPPAAPTTPEAPTPQTFVEATAHERLAEPLAITREVQRSRCQDQRRSCDSRRAQGRQSVMTRRGYRGQQGAAARSSDRVALAPDQGAARLRHRLHLLLLLRQADLQHPGLAVRLGGGRGKFEIHLHRAAGIFHHPVEARAVRRRLHLVSDRRHADLQVRRARVSTSTSATRSCLI